MTSNSWRDSSLEKKLQFSMQSKSARLMNILNDCLPDLNNTVINSKKYFLSVGLLYINSSIFAFVCNLLSYVCFKISFATYIQLLCFAFICCYLLRWRWLYD